MSEERTSAFQTALDAVERLTLEEKEMLFEIARHRLIKERRQRLAHEIAETREAYQKDDVHRGSVDDLMEALEA